MNENDSQPDHSESMFGNQPLLKNPWFWGFIIGLVFVTGIRPFLSREPPPPPMLGEIPEFSLIDQEGQPFTRESMLGSIHVVGFFFTRCPSICPTLMEAMARLQKRYKEEGVGVKLIAISVDPEHDVPAQLWEFGEKFGADFDRWSFLTGPLESVESLVEEGLMTEMGRPTPVGGNRFEIAHAAKFVLIDAKGGIRGYYGTDEVGLDEIFHRSKQL